MSPASAKAGARSARSVRSDGAQTRERILRVAGRMFADKGFERTTSREVCAAAGTNMAAVNYHFGSREGLCEAVFVEAHDRLVRLGELEELARAPGTPASRLAALLRLFALRSAGRPAPWALRVLAHEMIAAPSSRTSALVRKAIAPKARVVAAIVADALGVPAGDPVAQRAAALVALPFVMMAIAPPGPLETVFPALLADPESLAGDATRYATAGLRALGRGRRGDAACPPRNRAR